MSDGEESMRRQPEITDQTRRNLLGAFWSLYAEKRIDRITVKEITARAGYNRGTFYEYFNDVHGCLECLEDQVLPELDELPPIPDAGSPTPDFIESFTRLYREKLAYYDVLLGDRGDPSFQRRLIDGIKKAILAALKGRKGERWKDAVEVDYALEYVLSGMVGVLRYFFHNRAGGSPVETAAMIHRVMQGDVLKGFRDRLG